MPPNRQHALAHGELILAVDSKCCRLRTQECLPQCGRTDTVLQGGTRHRGCNSTPVRGPWCGGAGDVGQLCYVFFDDSLGSITTPAIQLYRGEIVQRCT